jgi:hypothetical protein
MQWSVFLVRVIAVIIYYKIYFWQYTEIFWKKVQFVLTLDEMVQTSKMMSILPDSDPHTESNNTFPQQQQGDYMLDTFYKLNIYFY